MSGWAGGWVGGRDLVTFAHRAPHALGGACSPGCVGAGVARAGGGGVCAPLPPLPPPSSPCPTGQHQLAAKGPEQHAALERHGRWHGLRRRGGGQRHDGSQGGPGGAARRRAGVHGGRGARQSAGPRLLREAALWQAPTRGSAGACGRRIGRRCAEARAARQAQLRQPQRCRLRRWMTLCRGRGGRQGKPPRVLVTPQRRWIASGLSSGQARSSPPASTKKNRFWPLPG
jgi:hypothetical protein